MPSSQTPNKTFTSGTYSAGGANITVIGREIEDAATILGLPDATFCVFSSFRIESAVPLGVCKQHGEQKLVAYYVPVSQQGVVSATGYKACEECLKVFLGDATIHSVIPATCNSCSSSVGLKECVVCGSPVCITHATWRTGSPSSGWVCDECRIVDSGDFSDARFSPFGWRD
jgi:hypothetical protein